MHKKQVLYIAIIILIIIAIVVFAVYKDRSNKAKALSFDPMNAAYTIDGTTIILKDGLSEISVAPGSVSKIITKYIGFESNGDIDKDGRDDAVFVLSQEGGGSGTFYYLAALLNKESGPMSPTASFFGDRVKPIKTEVRDGVVKVSFMSRVDLSNMSDEPTVPSAVSFVLNKNTMTFESITTNDDELVNSNESTSTTDKIDKNLKLDSKTWVWVSTQYNNDKIVKPKMADKFTITFDKDNKVHITTDCNSMNSMITHERNGISFGPIMSTKMYCEGSQELVFQKMLSEVSGYLFTDKGELVLMLKMDTGSMVFK